jgi:putative spermidine/putrescine transport system permease protein
MDESMLGAVRERAGEDARALVPTVVDAGSTATFCSDRVLFGGLVALVVAATMSGLRTDVTIWGFELTIRPDQVVLLALLPAIAVALMRRGLARWWSVLHIPVFAFLSANALASVAASGVRDVSLQGTALMTVYVAMYTGVVVLITDRPAWARRLLAVVVGLGFIYVPLLIVLVNSFNADRTFAWPPTSLTTHWWGAAWDNTGAREALWTSVKTGIGAAAIALTLGTMIAFAVGRYRFFGRNTVSLLVVLPIALPGIVTGIALNSAFNTGGVPFGYLTVIVGHATFCIVVVYNNVLARLRRTGTTLEEASQDLGATTFQTFARVTFPQLRSALLAGALLAFALSFDEIVVTTFTAGPGLQIIEAAQELRKHRHRRLALRYQPLAQRLRRQAVEVHLRQR